MPDNLVHGNYAVTISDLEGADDLKFFQCDMPSGTVQISNVKHFGADNGTPVPLSGGGHQTTWNPITMTRYKDASTALYDWFKKVTEVGAVEGDTKQSPTIVVHSNDEHPHHRGSSRTRSSRATRRTPRTPRRTT